MAVELQGGSMVYVDPPARPGSGDEPAITEVSPRLQPNRWRFRFPWVKTAVGAPTYNGDLLIENCTDHVWMLWHNYHALGPWQPGERRAVRLVRHGTLSAKQGHATASSEYLLADLTPTAVTARIADLSGGEGYYALELFADRFGVFASLPSSLPIEDLNLSARAENTLKRAGVATVGDLRAYDLDELFSMQSGLEVYAELVDRFLMRGSLE